MRGRTTDPNTKTKLFWMARLDEDESDLLFKLGHLLVKTGKIKKSNVYQLTGYSLRNTIKELKALYIKLKSEQLKNKPPAPVPPTQPQKEANPQ